MDSIAWGLMIKAGAAFRLENAFLFEVERIYIHVFIGEWSSYDLVSRYGY